jgi:hypothetical protein
MSYYTHHTFLLRFPTGWSFTTHQNPRKDAATSSLVDTFAANEPPSQEATVVVKSLDTPIKKGTHSHVSKSLKKAMMVSTYLDTHRPVSSPDDVSSASCGLLCLLL